MDTSAVYVEIDSQRNIRHYGLDLENGADLKYIERYLPVLARPGRAIEDLLHEQLMEDDFELSEYLEDGTEWGILLDRGHKVLLLYGFGGGWRLPDKALARLVLPLLQSRGWQGWRLEHTPLGTWQFAQYLQLPLSDPGPESISYTWPLHDFEAYPPQHSYCSNENLLVSLRHEGRWRHYLCISDEGHGELRNMLGRGPGVMTELEIFPECELPDETAVRCTLLIDNESCRLAYSFERAFDFRRPFDAEEVSRGWPGWQIDLLPDSDKHLELVTEQSEAAWLQLNPLRLQAWMQELLAGEPATACALEQGLVMPPAELMLAEWFEQILPHPELGPYLVRELQGLVPELVSDRPAACLDPNPAYSPTAYDRNKTIYPKPAETIAAIPRELLLLYACLYGHPPWLAETLGWPLSTPPSNAELTIELDLLARDPGLRWQWLWLLECFMRRCATYNHDKLQTQWPLHMYHVEQALTMTLCLLKACQRHLQSAKELSCLVRILDICYRLAALYKDPSLPPIEEQPARQLSHQLMLQDAMLWNQLDEASRRQVLELFPELTPVQQEAWRQRAKTWPPTEQDELIRSLTVHVGKAVRCQ